ncbi:hypothetical protein HJFPF1_06694 [Paramyrothecium foliicola]|nr:hypothetical protein HJFPF1_06694 [Paramyrothecium foliicola]
MAPSKKNKIKLNARSLVTFQGLAKKRVTSNNEAASETEDDDVEEMGANKATKEPVAGDAGHSHLLLQRF